MSDSPDSKQSSVKKVTALAVVILVTVTALIWAKMAKSSFTAPEPKAGDIYYRGPMKSKGDPNVFGNEDGSRAAAPAGAVTKKEAAPKAGPGGGIGSD